MAGGGIQLYMKESFHAQIECVRRGSESTSHPLMVGIDFQIYQNMGKGG